VYTVPAGVEVLEVQAQGAQGGPGPSGAGGYGEDLLAYLPVQPGEHLYTEVGQEGIVGGGATFGGGGAAGTQTNGLAAGSSGGGATDVRLCSEKAASCPGGGTSLQSRVIVAGGGGGDGGTGNSYEVVCGGAAFAGNSNGGTIQAFALGHYIVGGNNSSVAPSTQATGGTGSAPGGAGLDADCTYETESFPGAVPGTSGSGSTGGTGGSVTGNAGSGGGGGGGYFGGGGSSSGQTCVSDPAACSWGADGDGGGGGSSFVSSKAWIGSQLRIGSAIAPPTVTFTPIIAVTSPAEDSSFILGQVVDASFGCDQLELGTCTGAVATGMPINTATIGTHTFLVQGETSGQTLTGTVTYTVKRATKTAVTCAPAPVKAHHAAKCTVTVSDTSTAGNGSSPTGTVTFSAAGSGAFASPASCSLKKVSAPPDSGSCSVKYTPTKTGKRLVVASYPGDKVHAASKGSVTVKISK
jgi:hypothetical protein